MKKLLISFFAVIFILIIGLFLFFKPIVEISLAKAGFPDARIGSASLTPSGTFLKNITLDSKGNRIGNLSLYATAGDIFAGRLGKIVVGDADIKLPFDLPSQTSQQKPERLLALNLFTRIAEFNNINILAPTPAGDMLITAEGILTDEGDEYKLRATVSSDNQSSKLFAQINASAEKKTGDLKAHAELADTSFALSDVEIRRIAGWISADVPAATLMPVINAQLTAGSVKVFDIPLQGSTLSVSSTKDKTEAILTASAAGNTGDINVDIKLDQADSAVDKLAVAFNAGLKDLEALGISGLAGLGVIDVALTGEKLKSAALQDISAWKEVKGFGGISARKLSIPDLLSGASASGKLALGLDPAQSEISVTTFEGPFTAKGKSKGQDFSLNITKGAALWNQKTNALKLDLDGVDLGFKDLSIAQGKSNLTFWLGAAPVIEGDVSAGVVKHLANPAYIVPVSFKARFQPLSSLKNTTGFSADISDKSALLYMKAEGKINLSASSGDAILRIPPITLIEGVHSLAAIFPISAEYAEDTSGTIGTTARIAWDNKGYRTSGELYLKDFNTTIAGNIFTGINTVLKLDSLAPPVFSQQDIAIGGVDIGLPLSNGLLNLSLDAKNTLTQHKAEFDMAGGKLSASPFVMPLDTLSTEVTLTATQLNIPALFSIAPLEGLAATGTVNGTLPLKITDGNAYLENGVLETTGTGVIQYSADKLPPFLRDSTQPQIIDLRTALTAFEYEQLKMVLNGDLSKNQQINLQIKGKNPAFYNGRAVNFNLNVEGPLQSILKYKPGGSQIPDTIKKQLEEYEKQHAK